MEELSSFDKEDKRVKHAVVPSSVNDNKVVKLSQKTLTTKKIVRKVLPEEKYVKNLEKIIEKDYFPELKKMQAQKDYLEAVANKDVVKIRELQMKYCSGASIRTNCSFRTPGTSTSMVEIEDTPSSSTPAYERTPAEGNDLDWIHENLPYANEEGDNEAIARKRRKKQNINLTTYLNKFTSEDNASFEELAQVTKEREEAKRKWLYEAEEKHNKEKIAYQPIAAEADVQLAIKSASDADDLRPNAVDNWKYTAWNTVLFNPDGVSLTKQEAIEAAKKQKIEINKNATRFPGDLKLKPSDEAMSRAAVNQALNNVGKVDVLGQEVNPTNSLKLLATPQPDPEIMDSPLMTWGEIDGTPFRLDQPDFSEPSSGAPTFKIPDIPFREKIAQNMHDSIADKYREKRKIAMKAAEGAHKTPGFGSTRKMQKLAQLSPAAQRFASKKLGLQVAKTPAPQESLSIRSWIKSPARASTTPGSSWSSGAQTPRTPILSMVRKKEPTKDDDRAKAGDFF
ncbi:unnamed protein product [Caenorhabditis bovis]|uniref:Splicing factor ESS-2 homolog n=1 Tax=Caenorhabditis bovis TaxID=2654633 RepID=A0A8S1ES67_9PELO|nr:unnamed protein product [Caenorhabditis bovis]